MRSEQIEFVVRTLKASPFHLECLRIARSLGMRDWAIGAGFVRNAVWDQLHGFKSLTPLQDVDVLHFDDTCQTKHDDELLESHLRSQRPEVLWSVRNQARMHLRNGDDPYLDTEDAMRYWLETPTCVAARLNDDDQISIIAPYGLDDLIEMRVQQTPAGKARSGEYLERIQKKDWPSLWPRVIVTQRM